MRNTRSALYAALLFCVGSICAGCGDDDASAPNSGVSGSAGTGGTGGAGGTAGTAGSSGTGGTAGSADACAGATGVCLLFVDDFDVKGDVQHAAANLSNFGKIDALVVAADGTASTFPSKTFDDGHVEIADVPDGEYWIRFTSKPADGQPAGVPAFQAFVVSSLRKIDFGKYFVERANTVPLTASAPIHVAGALALPWLDAASDPTFNEIRTDVLYLSSPEAGALGVIFADATDATQTNPPTNLATSLDWTFNATQALNDSGWSAREVSMAAGDALILTQSRSSLISDLGEITPKIDDAWKNGSYDFVVSSAAGSADIAPGSTGQFTGQFSPVTTTESLVVDFHGAEFFAIASASITDNTLPISVSSTIDISFERGTTEVSYSPNPPLASFFAFGSTGPVDPTCFPDDMGMCDTMLCPTGCNPDVKTIYPLDLQINLDVMNPYASYPGSLLYGQGLFFNVPATHPTQQTNEKLRGYVLVSGKTDTAGLPPAVGVVKNVKIGGQPTLHQSSLEGVGATPTISWDAPTTGASHYRVVIVDLEDVTSSEGVVSAYRNVARIDTTGTKVVIAPGVLLSGHAYHAQIVAMQDAVDPAKPNRFPTFLSATTAFPTGIFTP